MNALFLDAPGVLSLRGTPVPTPGLGELLIRVRAATTCGTDLKAWRRGHPQIPMPGPFGHEWSGTVAAAGEGAPLAVMSWASTPPPAGHVTGAARVRTTSARPSWPPRFWAPTQSSSSSRSGSPT
ncbi:MAG: hypothetical protein C4320_08090 [Armatimonadota bacterium]